MLKLGINKLEDFNPFGHWYFDEDTPKGKSLYKERNESNFVCPLKTKFGWIEVDYLIYPAIAMLNKKGYITTNSCSGHNLHYNRDNTKSYGYISFADYYEDIHTLCLSDDIKEYMIPIIDYGSSNNPWNISCERALTYLQSKGGIENPEMFARTAWKLANRLRDLNPDFKPTNSLYW